GPHLRERSSAACITETRRRNLGHPSGTVSPGASMTNRKYRAVIGLLSLLAIPSLTRVTIAAQQSPPPQQSAGPQVSDDPFVWLEDIDGQRSMDWVNTKNAATIAALT